MPLLSRLLRRMSQKDKDPRQSQQNSGSRSAASSNRRHTGVVRNLTWAGHVDDSSTDDFEEAFLAFLNQPQPFAPRVAAGITEEDQEDFSQYTLAAKVEYQFPRRLIAPSGASTGKATGSATKKTTVTETQTESQVEVTTTVATEEPQPTTTAPNTTTPGVSFSTPRQIEKMRKSDNEDEAVVRDEVASDEIDDENNDDDDQDVEDGQSEHDARNRNVSFDSGICVASVDPSVRKRGGSDDSLDMTTWLPSEVWEMVANYLPATTAAALTMTGRRMYRYLGNQYINALNLEENRMEKANFCVIWRINYRTTSSAGSTYDSACPRYAADAQVMLSRDRVVPWDLVNLATRSIRYSPAHGIPLSALSKKWTSESGWRHTARALIVDDHLLIKASSLSWVEPYMSPSELRVVVDERYHERFSHCKHLGASLDKFAKCAVSHIRPGYQVTTQCASCRVLRRCHQCPSEYLISIKLVEDKSTNSITSPRTLGVVQQTFRHALAVTRWTDLGAGICPSESLEWCASSAPLAETWALQKAGFFGARTVRSRFEAKDGNRVPEVPAQDLKNSMRWHLARLEREREEYRERQERASDLESERRRMRLFLAYSRANTEPLIEHPRGGG